MEEKVKRVLFVNSEMAPYMEGSKIGEVALKLAQATQERKVEIRSFMPRYGCVNERKNQLHEVIRLSGMNIILDNVDRPLIIKVASLPAARMQVYFIDNEDYFRRKAVYRDETGKYFADNGERAVFFARGVLETVKKLRWSPDIVHCSGWISHVVPLYLKKCYKDDPIFAGSKVVLSLYNDNPDMTFSDTFTKSMKMNGVEDSDLDMLKTANGTNLAKLAIAHSDAVIFGAPKLPQSLVNDAVDRGLRILKYDQKKIEDGTFVNQYQNIYNSL